MQEAYSWSMDLNLPQPYLMIKYAMKIIGDGRNKTFIQGGGLIFRERKKY